MFGEQNMDIKDGPFKEAAAKIKRDLEEGDQQWRSTVDRRYGRLMLNIALDRIKRAENHFDLADSAPAQDRPKLYRAASEGVASAAIMIQGAGFLLSGHMKVPEPFGAEMAIRLHALANTPTEKATP